MSRNERCLDFPSSFCTYIFYFYRKQIVAINWKQGPMPRNSTNIQLSVFNIPSSILIYQFYFIIHNIQRFITLHNYFVTAWSKHLSNFLGSHWTIYEDVKLPSIQFIFIKTSYPTALWYKLLSEFITSYNEVTHSF